MIQPWVFARFSLVVVATAICSTVGPAQETTRLAAWSTVNDPFAKDYGETISASAPLAGVPGARAKITATCRRVDSDGKNINPASIEYRISVINASIDIHTESVPHQNLDNTDYELLSTVALKLKYGNNAPVEVRVLPLDSHSFKFSANLPPFQQGQKLEMLDPLIGFPVAGEEVILSFSGREARFAKFASDCQTPTAQEQAADAARQEQARIAQGKAAEQARIATEQTRIAQQQAAEQARQKAEAQKNQYDAAIAKLTDYLGLGSIPDFCIRKYGTPDQSTFSVVVDLDTTRRSIEYASQPATTPEDDEALSGKWQHQYHNVVRVVPAGARLEISLNETAPSGPFYLGIPNTPSDKRYIPTEDFNSPSGRWNIAVDALKFCSQKRSF